MKKNKRIGISFGDVAGVGPEIIFKSLSSPKINKNVQYILFGSEKILLEASKLFPDKKIDVNFRFADDVNHYSTSISTFADFKKIKTGQPNVKCAKAAISWIEQAVEAFKKGLIDGLVTAPINKAACYNAKFNFRGHTDFIASMFGNPPHRMAFFSRKLKLVLLSHHLSLKAAVKDVKSKTVFDTIIMAYSWMKSLGANDPKILISGLNPHAGEEGALGDEELRCILPAVLKAENSGINVSGPLPPDTVFRAALDKKDTIVVSMYHDQGLIPFKLVSFDNGVNVTIGLPLVRTSPDHGTAYDIAWTGKASEKSMVEAINLCCRTLNAR